MNTRLTEESSENLFWHANLLPQITKAGRFYNKERHFKTVYQAPSTHRLHLYEYDGKMRLGKQMLQLTKGTITISPASKKTAYHVDDPGGGWHYSVCFSAKIKAQSKDPFSFAIPLYRPPTGFAAHESRLREIITLFNRGKKSELAAFAASNALLQLFMRISLYSHDTDPDDDGISTLEKKLRSLENYIEIQLEHDLHVGDLAAHCDLSPDYLAQMFKKNHGVPLQRYILIRRI